MTNPSDKTNRATWDRVADEYALEGWSDPGEVEAFRLAASLVRGRPALDLGVGGGRTTALMRLMTDDYTAIDYSKAMVALCRDRHPGVDVRLGDARDLSAWPDGSLGFVLFSNNGLDAVSHSDRVLVLAEVARVLEPGGVFLVSTLNKNGGFWASGPGDVPSLSWVPGSLLPSEPQEAPVDEHWGKSVARWRRLERLRTDDGDWGIAPFAAHGYGLLTHFTTVAAARTELERVGFNVLAVVPCDAPEALAEGVDTSALFVHVVAVRNTDTASPAV